MDDDVRVRRPDRSQPAFEVVDVDRLVPPDHRVRDVWAFVETLDLSQFYARIKARGETAGRPAVDPRILRALWLYATIDGMGSARGLARLCEHHLIYRWICGGVGVNHELLRAFRNESDALLDQLLSQTLTALIDAGLIKLDELATDGTKVRALASRSSMRRKPRVADIESELKAHIAKLREELDADPSASERRLKQRLLAVDAGLAHRQQPRRDAEFDSDIDNVLGRHGGGLPQSGCGHCQCHQSTRAGVLPHSIWNQISIGLPGASRAAISATLSRKFF